MSWDGFSLSFWEYVQEQDDPERKKRDDLRKLELLERLVRRGGMTAKMVRKKRPYLYVWSQIPGLRGGAKVYQEGDQITYKYQTSMETKSGLDQFTTARVLPIQQIFLDLQAESDKTEVQVAVQMADEVARRFKSFFKEMAKAIKIRNRKRDDGSFSIAHASREPSDFSQMVNNPV